MGKIWQAFRETTFSLFSDGKISMKRCIAFGTFILVSWMIVHLITTVIPESNRALFEHCFDGLLLLITVLLGAATWADSRKNRTTAQQTTVETPVTTTTQTTVDAPVDNTPKPTN